MDFYTFLPKLVNMSLTGAIAIICVLLLRILLKKAPKVISYALWAVVLLRLLCPFSIESDLSLFGLMDAPTTNVTTIASSIAYVPENIVQTEFPEVALPVPSVSETSNSTLPIEEEQLIADPLEVTVAIGTFVWLSGVLIMALYSIISYIQLHKKLLIVSPLQKNIYLADEITTPFVMGLLRPRIYIPSDMAERQLSYIILHEQHHIRRGDHIMKAVAFLALSIHWFNPLVWVAFVYANKDMEMSCDEAVVKKMGDDILADYTASLLSLATGKTIIAGMPLAFGEGDTKGRIRNLANWKKPAFWVVLVAIIACVALSIGLLTNPAKEDTVDYIDDESSFLGGEESVPVEENMTTVEAFPINDDGSYRLSEYQVELTGDKSPEKIVFDVYYWADLEGKSETITEELLWEELWNGCEVMVRVLTGADDKVLWEHSYSDAHAGNGNLAVVKFQNQYCLMRYHNLMYQGSGQLFYQILQLQETGEDPLVLAQSQAVYEGDYGTYEEDEISQVLKVAEELDRYLTEYSTKILVNASVNREHCYLHGSKQGLLNGVRRQTAFDVFIQEVGGNGWELNLLDFFYPDGMESLTKLPEDAEDRIRAGEILCMKVSPDNPTAGRLDLDNDGVREVLYLYGVSNRFGSSGWRSWTGESGGDIIDENYRIRVNGKYYEDYCDIMDPVLMAYSPDEKQILLAVYDDGPSNDPQTFFFRYDKNGVHPAGMITDDLREVSIDGNGVIKGKFRADMIQTEWAYGYYIWNGSEIVMREDEIYYLLDDSGWREVNETPLLLLEEITVYEERSEDSRAIVMKPQKVSNVATDRKEWVLLKADDGTRGWLRVDQGKIAQLDGKRTFEVFEGLNMAD